MMTARPRPINPSNRFCCFVADKIYVISSKDFRECIHLKVKFPFSFAEVAHYQIRAKCGLRKGLFLSMSEALSSLFYLVESRTLNIKNE